MGDLIRFPNGEKEVSQTTTPSAPAEVFVFPSAVDGGSWAVVHYPAGSDDGTQLGTRFAMGDAVAVAEEHAARFGARFGGVAI